jgi:hypothetical protein
MGANLVGEIRVGLATTEQCEHPSQERSHGKPLESLKNFATMPAARCQSPSSV